MVERTTKLAQSAAEGLSRRGFLSRFGRAAGITAVALGGMIMVPDDAQAGKRCGNSYHCPKGQFCLYGRCYKKWPTGKRSTSEA